MAAQGQGVLIPSYTTLALTAVTVSDGSVVVLDTLQSPPSANQRWTVNGGFISIASNPNLVLAAGGPSASSVFLINKNTASAPSVISWTKVSTANAPTVLDGTAFTKQYLINGATGLALDVTSAGTKPGATVSLYKTNGGSNQLWAYNLVAQIVPSITLYDVENYNGPSVVINQEVSDLNTVGFASKTNSITVQYGTWILYYAAGFPGDINSFWVVSANGGANSDGKYATPAEWGDWAGGNRIGAVRPLPDYGIVLFENPWFGGRATTIIADTPSLTALNFEYIVSAVVVRSGTWYVYATDQFQGQQNVVFARGGFYSSGFYPQAIQWGGNDNYLNSLKLIR